MNITLNGEEAVFDGSLTVEQLIETKGWTGQRIAVERNGEIVPRSQYSRIQLEEGDQLEIVVAVGGG